MMVSGAKKGEVTAYLSLIFILFISFVGGIMESASVQMAKNYRRADMNRAMESVFAEYQKELLDEYEIFALEATYETGTYGERNIKKRLEFYGAEGMEQSVKRLSLLTDHGGQPFLEQVAVYMEEKYGMDKVKDLTGKSADWKTQEEEAEKYEENEKKQQGELDQLLEENEGELPEKDNPIAHVAGLKKSSLLELVMPKGKEVSDKQMNLADTLEYRGKREGYGDFSDVSEGIGKLDHLLLGEYLMEHFPDATKAGQKGDLLDYQLEYFLEGKGSDRENLEAVVKKLLMLRFVPNYIYLQGNAAKKAEAKAMALSLCAVLAVPAVTEAAAQAILLAWAYGESLVDIRSLLGGGKIPLVKSDENWQLSLSGLLKLGEDGDLNDGKDCKEGLGYRDYVRMLLFLTSKEKLGLRALDMIEGTLRGRFGLVFFRADQCISKIEMKSTCKLRRGITYQFPTYYGYR